jgi:enoyl-CoA hydratase/carnithine racemase
LVNRVVPAEQLDAAVEALASQIARGCPEIVALGKRAFYRQQSLDEVAAYGEAVELITANALRPEAQEGIAAFLQRRAPRWKGV